jgi:hypothetical protein
MKVKSKMSSFKLRERFALVTLLRDLDLLVIDGS